MRFWSAKAGGLLELRQHLPGPLDRPGHELREEADEGGEAQEIPLARDLAQVEIDGVAHRLKREERDAHRQHIRQSRAASARTGLEAAPAACSQAKT